MNECRNEWGVIRLSIPAPLASRLTIREDTTVVIDSDEVVIEEIRVKASATQLVELQEWAVGYEERSWAVESARGLGYLLSQ